MVQYDYQENMVILQEKGGTMERKYINNIAYYRKAIKKTQRELAVDIGVSDVTIQNFEYGIYAPTIYSAKKIAKALQAEIDDVFPDCEETRTA